MSANLLPIFLLTFALFGDDCLAASESAALEYSYSVIIDAGSSGTRGWIYKWNNDAKGMTLPRYQVHNKIKTSVNLASLAGKKDLLKETITGILARLAEYVPSKLHSTTSVFLFATAGMRVLPEDEASKLFENLQEFMTKKDVSQFVFTPHNARILSGEEEGVFAWIAVNYLTGTLQDPSMVSKTNGILELGGASTQIAFVPRTNILADKFPITVAGQKFSLYAHSFLNFGQDAVDEWVMDHLINASDSSLDTINNPCVLKGDIMTVNKTREIKIQGTGDPHQCAHLLGYLVQRVNPRFCHPKPCSIGTVYQPTIYENQTFHALSVFRMILLDLKVLDADFKFTPSQLFEKSFAYCKKDFNELKSMEKEWRWKFISKPCVMGVYMALLFTKGYGFHNESRQIISDKKLDADWTLGALIYEQSSSGSCRGAFPPGNSGSSLRPSAIFISVPRLPSLHSFFSSFPMTFFPTGSLPADAILIYLVFGAIFKCF